MLHRSSMYWLMCAAVLTFTVVLVGCPGQDAEMDTDVDMTLLDDVDAEMFVDAGDADFAWTEEPTVDMIPSGQVRGEMAGRPFEALTVRLKKEDEGIFELTISSKAVEGDDPTAMLMGDDAWRLTFSGTEGETGTWTWSVAEEKDFSKEHVYYYYAREEGGPMSVNYPWGAALRIDEWAVHEADEDAGTFHDAIGNVKGGVVLVMDDDEKSWVAGEFDAVYYEW